MADKNKVCLIPSRLKSTTTDGIVAGASDIYDDTQSKFQSEINEELIDAIGTGGTVDSKITDAINKLDANISKTAGSDGLSLSVIEENGKITSINGSITANTYDAYGSASAAQEAAANDASLKVNAAKVDLIDRINAEKTRAQGVEGNLQDAIDVNSGTITAEINRAKSAESLLQEQYDALTQSDIIVGTLPASGQKNKIYRVPGESSYADYMYAEDGDTTPIKMAEYNNATDSKPIEGSLNIPTSGGVQNYVENHGKLLCKGVWLLENHFINHPGDGKNYIEPDPNFDVVVTTIPFGARNLSVNGGNALWTDLFDNYTDFSVEHHIQSISSTTDLINIPAAKTAITTYRKSDNPSGYYDIYPVWTYDVIANMGDLPSCSLNNVKNTGSWLLIDANTYTDTPNGAGVGFLRVSYVDEWVLQEFFDWQKKVYERKFRIGSEDIEDWSQVGAFVMDKELPSCDLNDVRDSGTWLLSDNHEYEHTPIPTKVGFLRVSHADTFVLQEFFTFSGSQLFKRKFRYNATTVEEWGEIGKEGSGTVNNYTFNEYNQTVNLQATPVIKADTNNYLASTGDTTDRTADILTMLQATGACHLGPGMFYVDSIIMPDDSSIIGSGSSTKVYLKEGDNRFAFKPGSRCLIKDMKILGGNTTSSNVGTRHAVLWQGEYTRTQDSSLSPAETILEGLHINGFNGGGITCYDTGYGTTTHLFVSNCEIWYCSAGINVSYWSEFHKFTNIRCHSCYYGCINNGGNNIFVNCDFSSNSGIAFLMDNSQSQSPNNSHGSCIGCVFNHTASNTGTGIKILNCNNGFIFNGCQIFYSKIYIEDSHGIVISSCNFGSTNCDITINRGGLVLFDANVHGGTPSVSITGNQKVHFVNCYNHSTGELVGA